MDEIIARSLQGLTSDAEEELLRNWREEHAENEISYQRVAAVWRATRSYELPIRTQMPDVESLLAEAARRRAVGARRRPWMGRIAGVAAALVIGLGVGLWWTDRPLEWTQVGELVTGPEETSTARLPDGTVVRLGPESRLVFEVGAATREVRFSGQAFFSVAHDTGRPFVVRTNAGDTRVLGTRFELTARDRDMRVIVLEGRVAVAADGKEVELGRRQVGHVRQGAQPSVVEVNDVWAFLGWMGAFVAFESTPLSEAAWELERRFGLILEIEDQELADQTVTVWFGDEPVDRIAGIICQLVEASCVVENSIVRMKALR